MICEQRSVHRELEVDGVPLEVVVMLLIDVAVDNGLTKIEEEEHGHHREGKSGPVPCQSEIEKTISFKGSERMIDPVG